jgi:succinate dehydrogenase / fumarate reductase membrane anchor subunit
LGVQVVIEDYVHGAATKVAALILSALAHFGLTVAALFAVLRIAFSSA